MTQKERLLSFIRDSFSRTGKKTILLRSVPSRTWGYTLQIWIDNQKVSVISGCGFDKEIAALVEAGHILTGKYIVSRGKGKILPEYKDSYSLTCLFDGKSESAYQLSKKEKS